MPLTHSYQENTFSKLFLEYSSICFHPTLRSLKIFIILEMLFETFNLKCNFENVDWAKTLLFLSPDEYITIANRRRNSVDTVPVQYF